MSKYNSIIDSVHAKMDKFIESGLLDESAKLLDVQSALMCIANTMLDQADSTTKAAVEAENESAECTIADQLGIILDVVAANAAAANPLTALTVDTTIGSDTDLLGKVVADLQDDIEITDRKITGNINYVDDYTGFSSLEEEQSGHYIALRASVPDVNGVTIKAKTSRLVTLDSDGILVLRFKNDKTYPITFIAEKEGYGAVKKTYNLSGLKLLPAENAESEG